MTDNKMSIGGANKMLTGLDVIRDNIALFKKIVGGEYLSQEFWTDFNVALEIITALQLKMEKELEITLGAKHD